MTLIPADSNFPRRKKIVSVSEIEPGKIFVFTNTRSMGTLASMKSLGLIHVYGMDSFYEAQRMAAPGGRLRTIGWEPIYHFSCNRDGGESLPFMILEVYGGLATENGIDPTSIQSCIYRILMTVNQGSVVGTILGTHIHGGWDLYQLLGDEEISEEVQNRTC